MNIPICLLLFLLFTEKFQQSQQIDSMIWNFFLFFSAVAVDFEMKFIPFWCRFELSL